MTLMTFTIGGMCIYQPRNILDIFLNRTIFRRRSDAGIFPADTKTVCDGKPETSLLKMIKNCEIWDPLAVNSEQSNHIYLTDHRHSSLLLRDQSQRQGEDEPVDSLNWSDGLSEPRSIWVRFWIFTRRDSVATCILNDWFHKRKKWLKTSQTWYAGIWCRIPVTHDFNYVPSTYSPINCPESLNTCPDTVRK